MTYDGQLKLNVQVCEEAAQWFVEFRTGDVDAAGRRAFDAWLRSSQEHLRAYLEIAAIWNEGSSLDAQRALDVDALILLARAQENVIPLAGRAEQTAQAEQDESANGRGVVGIGKRRWAIAASMAFLFLSAAMLYWLQAQRTASYATAVGEQRSIRLEDGSTVELNSRSQVRISFRQSERVVELLEGQALFHVAKDRARPFVVHSGDTKVRAVGTQFDVYKQQGGTVVTVLEGRVAVVPAGSGPPSPRTSDAELQTAVLLSAGEQLTVTAQALPQPIQVNVEAATAWTQRQLVVESAPLAEVAEEFNRYSTRRLVVEDSASAPLLLSGVFETDPAFLIRYLRARPDIAIRETDAEIRIVRHD